MSSPCRDGSGLVTSGGRIRLAHTSTWGESGVGGRRQFPWCARAARSNLNTARDRWAVPSIRKPVRYLWSRERRRLSSTEEG